MNGDAARPPGGQSSPPGGGQLAVWLEAAYRYGFALLFAVVALAVGVWFLNRLVGDVQQLNLSLLAVAQQLERQTQELQEIRRTLTLIYAGLRQSGA